MFVGEVKVSSYRLQSRLVIPFPDDGVSDNMVIFIYIYTEGGCRGY